MSQQLPLYISGSGLADLVVNSGLLHQSWAAIKPLEVEATQNQHQSSGFSLGWSDQKLPNCRVVAFETAPVCTKSFLRPDLVSSDTLRASGFPWFEFLCSKGHPRFSVNLSAIELFVSRINDLAQLKAQLLDATNGVCELDPKTGVLVLKTPLIITGHSLGGSIASLFALWLLDSINQTSPKLPICITFGSPLVGDKEFQDAIAERSKWNSCFLHVVAYRDQVPRFLVQSDNVEFKPFGTYLLVSELGSCCFDDPDVVRELFLETSRLFGSDQDLYIDYGSVVESLKAGIKYKGNSQIGPVVSSLQAGIILQLEAIGVNSAQQPLQENGINMLVRKLEEGETDVALRKKLAINPLRKLNEVKIKMAYLEWYKKTSKYKGIGYYDCYKTQITTTDREVAKHKKFLNKYWKETVEEAEKKPQKEGAYIRMTWLYAGTNYRRMVEPLDIAEYYRESGNRDYENGGREENPNTRHYALLEKWQKEDSMKTPTPLAPSDKKKQNVVNSLTEDSCFWAKVEEAIIACKVLNDTNSGFGQIVSAKNSLLKFELTVMQQIKDYAISPEIFLDGSSFMHWWRLAQGITLVSHDPELVDFMTNGRHRDYERGLY